MAPAVARAAEVEERRLLAPADVLDQAAAVDEHAGRQMRAELREQSRDGVEALAVLARAAARDAAQQPDGVRMARTLEDRPDRALLDEPPGVEHADAVAHPRDDVEVVADEEDRRAELPPQHGDEVEDLRFDRDVEAGRRLVEDEEHRVLGERHRDDHALLHPARQLVRVAAHDPWRVGDLHRAQHLLRPLAGLGGGHAGDREGLGDLVADADRRVQRAARVLVDHRHALRAQGAHVVVAHGEQVLARDPDRPGADAAVARQVADDRVCRRRLAAAGLADEAVRLARGDLERHAAQDRTPDFAHAIRDLKVVELERGHSSRRRRHRSKACVRPSAMRFTPMTRVAIAAGNSTGHQ